MSTFGGTNPAVHFCFFQKGVVLSIISKFRSNFHKELLGAERQLTDLHGHLSKMEAVHLPGFLLRSSIAQRESDCSRSVQFALIMRQLDRDTTAVTLPGVHHDSLIRIGCIFQLNQSDVYHILIFCDDSFELGEQLFQWISCSQAPETLTGPCVKAVASKLLVWHSQWVQRWWRCEWLKGDLKSHERDYMKKIDEPPGLQLENGVGFFA